MRWLLALTSLGFVSFFLTLASLPVYAVDGGASVQAAGLVTTAMLASTVAVQLCVPALVRRWGPARVFVIGMVLLPLPAAGYLVDPGLPWLVAVSAIRGAGFAMITVVSVTLLASIVPGERRGEAVGMHGLAVNVPNLVAVPAGAALTLSGHFPIVAVVAALPTLALAFAPRFERAFRAAGGSGHAAAAPVVTREALRPVLAPVLVLVVVSMVASGYLAFIPIEVGNSGDAGLALLVFGVSGMLARWRVGAIADRIGLSLLLPGALLAAAAGFLVVAVSLPGSALGWLVVGSFVAGLGYGGIQNLSLSASLARAGRRGLLAASAAWNIGFDTGIGLGALIVGYVAGTGLGFPSTYLLCALVLFAALPLAISAVPARWFHRHGVPDA